MAKPSFEYLRILYKINEIYTRYKLESKDLLDVIHNFESKKTYSENDLNNLEKKCRNEWKKALSLICGSLIKSIESKNLYKELLKIEYKETEKIKNKILNQKLNLEDYEKIFDFDLDKLKDNLDVKLFRLDPTKKMIEDFKYFIKETVGEEFIKILDRRDGAAVFPEKLREKYPAKKYATSGLRGDINKVWEKAGLLYLNIGRVADALDIFEGFYDWLIEYQETTGKFIHKGYPLVWMAECCTRAGLRSMAKRYLMLTLCEDSIANKGKIDPQTSGVYFRLVWQYGMNDSELQKYVKKIYELYQNKPGKCFYPEWILQQLDNEWISFVPSPNESMYYRVNSRYVNHLLSKFGSGTGKELEELSEYILSSMPGTRTYRRKKTHSTDHDIICAIEGTEADFRSELGRYFVCECKDWAKPADFTTVAKFSRVLDSSKCKFGILFSTMGITGIKATDNAAREIVKVYQDRGIVIIVIDKNDLKKIAEGKNFITILRTKYEKCRLDLT